MNQDLANHLKRSSRRLLMERWGYGVLSREAIEFGVNT